MIYYEKTVKWFVDRFINWFLIVLFDSMSLQWYNITLLGYITVVVSVIVVVVVSVV